MLYPLLDRKAQSMSQIYQQHRSQQADEETTYRKAAGNT
jgi:hypothetical protein